MDQSIRNKQDADRLERIKRTRENQATRSRNTSPSVPGYDPLPDVGADYTPSGPGGGGSFDGGGSSGDY